MIGPGDGFGAPLIGPPLPRRDGPAKVTGAARYATDEMPPGLAHGVFAESAIAAGRIRAVDAAAARAAPGVLAVLTHENAPRLAQVGQQGQAGRPGQSHMPLQDAHIFHAGQYVALVVAETIEAAEHAADLVRVEYEPDPAGPRARFEAHLDEAEVPPRIPLIGTPPVESCRGDPEAALAAAPVRLDLIYRTPVEHHVPMEQHGTVAAWDGDRVTVWDSTQHVYGVRSIVAKFLALEEEQVRVLSAFTGGAFGSKGSSWPHITFAAVAAREVGRPVRIWLGRRQGFVGAGHRSPTLQRMRVGAGRDGRLQALLHEAVGHSSPYDAFSDATAVVSRMLYACPAIRTGHRIVRVNVNTPTAMRAPGEAQGSYALECAMDELAAELGLDPLELRLRNYTERDEDEGGKPYSSKALRECYRQGAERFGWARRPLAPRTQRDGRWRVGQGMATAVYPGKQSPASARVTLLPDGRAEMATATQEIGTGGSTALAMVAAAALGLPLDRLRFAYGDTRLPRAPVSAGSQSTASVGSAIRLAAEAALRRLAALSGGAPNPTAWAEQVANHGPVSGEATYEPPDKDARTHAPHAFGAQFCEVRVAEDSGEVRVARWTGAFGCGRIVNARTAHSQLLGGIVWGIGMALLEETHLDARLGRFMNRNLAEYLVAVNADVPVIDAFFLPDADEAVNPIGAKNVGEIGICGAAAAIANAVFHATGRRIRDLPITPERMLLGTGDAAAHAPSSA
ncbi:xanthine dehydrogenase family protein molybdopterin-binding subunit [Paracraurococcus lichenis]|uniref:Xanthine dehydrogenase family protein molybdopterin-binding subunit n=1 Tax=Paracraurococcus lichenis TaxID=3064888 RepID=A0ABT9E7U7_9PROT|nr:xanthine dehydrogenase family protein molybdopterin-binding subunit [Paracraurococcus sp. LOR1-02]MDO9712281.1 xanthine dehydrogenase family protein molybdopterin-binding subunit [Paracraurococcus sp. LOR1-02]